MSRRNYSWVDVANFGANVYQAKKVNRMATAQEEQNQIMMAEIERMQMKEQMEQLNKKATKAARALVLSYEETLDKLDLSIHYYPGHAAVMAEQLEIMLNNSGLEVDFFEEMYEIERFQKVQRRIREFKSRCKSISAEDKQVRDLLAHYLGASDSLTKAIEVSESYDEVLKKKNHLDRKVKESEPQWRDLNRKMDKRRTRNKKILIVTLIFSIIAECFLLLFGSVISPMEEDPFEGMMIALPILIWILPALIVSVGFLFPVIPESNSYRLIREEQADIDYEFGKLNEKMTEIRTVWECEGTEDLMRMDRSWLEYIDQHSPGEDEFFEEPAQQVAVVQEAVRKPSGPPSRSPPNDARGEYDDDGYEWIEHPKGSEKWFYRESLNSDWKIWS